MGNGKVARRPIRARETEWAAATTRWLARVGARPNQVSVLSIVFATLAGLSLIFSQTGGAVMSGALLLVAATFILFRLLCNLFDGMLAIEEGKQSKSGEVFNELPDRLADSIILVSAGYSIQAPGWGGDLGWLAGSLALMTAHVRVLGGAVGVPQDFVGPMAKPQRMALMIAACLIAVVEVYLGWTPRAIAIALGVIAVGCVLTVARRTRRIVERLESK